MIPFITQKLVLLKKFIINWKRAWIKIKNKKICRINLFSLDDLIGVTWKDRMRRKEITHTLKNKFSLNSNVNLRKELGCLPTYLENFRKEPDYAFFESHYKFEQKIIKRYKELIVNNSVIFVLPNDNLLTSFSHPQYLLKESRKSIEQYSFNEYLKYISSEEKLMTAPVMFVKRENIDEKIKLQLNVGANDYYVLNKILSEMERYEGITFKTKEELNEI
jgi:hypothetical protein